MEDRRKKWALFLDSPEQLDYEDSENEPPSPVLSLHVLKRTRASNYEVGSSNQFLEFQYQGHQRNFSGIPPGSLQLVPGDQFSKYSSLGLTPNRSHDHMIPLLDENQVVRIKPYRYSAVQKTEIEKLIQEMLQAGVIRNNTSPFVSSIVMTTKSTHLKYKYHIHVIEELLDELGKTNFFSKLDLRSRYHQIRITHKGHYKFMIMPFGLTNAPSSFKSLMNQMFKPLLKRLVMEHLKHLREVLTLLRDNQLYAKKSKCSFGTTQVEYLGYTIAAGTVTMDRTKDLRGFLGLSGYYKRFIKGYDILAAPLTEAICKAPVLVLPDFQEEFCVETDASGQGVGPVLQQKGIPIAYFHKALGVRHQALSIYNKETMVVIMAIRKWHLYLVGRHFQIKIDQQSLRFLSDQQAITPYQQK
ncbi:reverse transcriptase [Gossypium australe]|uniref:Reverse transcriptase n=1 Tax=Gossypium australe TaxID=47621 RepID=A0A5B6VID6_9ROSI|nr:reverse transcriptase [Gossypium australe]